MGRRRTRDRVRAHTRGELAMNQSASTRYEIAARVADEVATQPDVVEVWLEGALAVGLAHAYSDIDLRVLVEEDQTPWRSRLVDGIRVDLVASDPRDLTRLRDLLGAFDVRFDD